MNDNLIKIINDCKSNDLKITEIGFGDLQLVIERHSQDRYGDNYTNEYCLLFSNREYLDIKIDNFEFDYIKSFLFYSILNYNISISPIIAKCIKVLYEKENIEAICKLIEYFIDKNDTTTDLLILSIKNMFNDGTQFNDERILSVFKKVYYSGKNISKERIEYIFNFHKNNYDNSFLW